MFGDHAQFGNRQAVISSAGTHGPTCLVAYEFYLMAHMWLEIDTAGGNFESLSATVFRNSVVAIRSAQATFDRGRVRVAAGVGSLCKPQGHQHGRYNHH